MNGNRIVQDALKWVIITWVVTQLWPELITTIGNFTIPGAGP